MSPFHPQLAARIQRLSSTLTQLQQRVRETIAHELGAVLGEAVQDLFRILATVSQPSPTPTTPSTWSSPQTWDEPDDDWFEPYEVSATPTEMFPRATLSQAVAVGLATLHWAANRRFPGWAGVGCGIVAGLAARCGGPVLAVGLVVADLLATGSRLT